MQLPQTDRVSHVLEGDAQEPTLRRHVNGFPPARTNLIRTFGAWLHDATTPTMDYSMPTHDWIARLGRKVNRGNLFQTIAVGFCVLFGLALIANTEPASDGVWFWYTSFFNSGRRLYADMHLALQPFYVLETSAFMAVLGKGWLVSRIPAVVHLVAYCLGLLLLVRQSKLSDMRKAIVLACSFFVSIGFGAIVFGDYHVLTDCFVLYSLLALLALRKSSSFRRTLALSAILGALSAVALTTRINDGAALFAGVFLAIVCLAPAKKLLSLVVFCLCTGFTVLLTVSLTGDSLHDYASYTIFKAAAIKGDGGSVLVQPLLLPWNTVKWLMQNSAYVTELYLRAFPVALILAFLLRELSLRRSWWESGLAVLGIAVVADLAHRAGILEGNALELYIVTPIVVLAYGLGIWVAARFILSLFQPMRANGWDPREILLLIPLGQMASGAMSSGGTPFSTIFEPAGVFILLLAICSPLHFKAESQPLRLSRKAFERLIRSSPMRTCFNYFVRLGQVLNLALLFRPLSRRRGWWELGLAVVGAAVIWHTRPPLQAHKTALFMDNALLLQLADMLVVLAFGLGIWVAARFVFRLFDPKRSNGWGGRDTLLLMPLGLLLTTSIVTDLNGAWGVVYATIGVFVVGLAIWSGFHLKAAWPRDTLFAWAFLLISCTAVYRFDTPYSWYTYWEKPMFADRVWYEHPDYGPMMIERDLLQMIQPICGKIKESGADNELLSLPWPTGNYFCSIAPWHGYVQTFFDTTSKQTIQALMNELQQSPPKWILYQRQLMTLRYHEIVYSQGSPLQQRYLGQFIEQQISKGIWRNVYTSDYGTKQFLGRQWDTEWILIQTR
jgi:hypothetical protein